jgi:hypothetical protein
VRVRRLANEIEPVADGELRPGRGRADSEPARGELSDQEPDALRMGAGEASATTATAAPIRLRWKASRIHSTRAGSRRSSTTTSQRQGVSGRPER